MPSYGTLQHEIDPAGSSGYSEFVLGSCKSVQFHDILDSRRYNPVLHTTVVPKQLYEAVQPSSPANGPPDTACVLGIQRYWRIYYSPMPVRNRVPPSGSHYWPMSARWPNGPNTESEITLLHIHTGSFPLVPAIEYLYNHSLVVYIIDAAESSYPCRAMLRIGYLIML